MVVHGACAMSHGCSIKLSFEEKEGQQSSRRDPGSLERSRGAWKEQQAKGPLI